jgi:hypothetical protein
MTFLPTLEAMKLMRSTWTDSRLDDFKTSVDSRLDNLNGRVGEIREDVRDLRGEIGALKRIIIQIGWGLFGTVSVGMLGLIGTQI